MELSALHEEARRNNALLRYLITGVLERLKRTKETLRKLAKNGSNRPALIGE
jgi:hypothetical protein